MVGMGEWHEILRWVLMVLSLLIFIGVFFGILGTLWWYHRSQQTKVPWGVVWVEISWALAPSAIVVLMVLPAVQPMWRFIG